MDSSDGSIAEDQEWETAASFSRPSTSPGSDTANNRPAVVPRFRRRPMPCKGHTKSRRGCLNCKRRRVKCPETRPQCTHCVRLGLPCEYPPPNPNPNAISPTGPMGNPRKSLSSTPTQFSMDDLRFFQHFLLTAYPPMPIGGDDIWRGVARLSHDVRLQITQS